MKRKKVICAEKPRILTICFGGTIGMQQHSSGKWLAGPRNLQDFHNALKPILTSHQQRMDITWEVMYTGDSTNVIPVMWTELAMRIRKAQEEGYEAVIVFHGTDTMSFTMAAVALALHGRRPKVSPLRVPVIFSGSQEPIYSEGSDGRFNVEHCFRLAEYSLKIGLADVVGVCMEDIILGIRSIKTTESGYKWLGSPGYRPVGQFSGHKVILYPEMLHMKATAQGSFDSDFAPKFAGRFVPISIQPGLCPDIFMSLINSDVDGFVLECLGEANIPTSKGFNFTSFIRKAVRADIPCVLRSAIPGGTAGRSLLYELGQLASEAGAAFALDTSGPAVWVKMQWLFGNKICKTPEQFRTAFSCSYAGEVSAL